MKCPPAMVREATVAMGWLAWMKVVRGGNRTQGYPRSGRLPAGMECPEARAHTSCLPASQDRVAYTIQLQVDRWGEVGD
jgi:hypothetical protein